MLKKLGGLILVVSLVGIFVYVLFYNTEYTPNKKMKIPFKVPHSTEKLMIFFGYVNCPTVCPMALSIMSSAYNKTNPENMKGVFIGLTDTTLKATDKWAKMFNPEFIGVKVDKEDQRKLVESFSVFWSPERPEIKKAAAHSPYIYFLKKENKEWILKQVYTQYPPIEEDLVKLIQAL